MRIAGADATRLGSHMRPKNPCRVPTDTANVDHAIQATDRNTTATSGPACSFYDFVLYGEKIIREIHS
jgi:hypothetical protein